MGCGFTQAMGALDRLWGTLRRAAILFDKHFLAAKNIYAWRGGWSVEGATI